MNIQMFQDAVARWVVECFGLKSASDRRERSLRFIEEAIELVQATGLTEAEVRRVAQYVFSRNVGRVADEIGGTIITLAALCEAEDKRLMKCALYTLDSCQERTDAIRVKNMGKPTFTEDVPASVRIPTSRAEAEAMHLVATRWLADHTLGDQSKSVEVPHVAG